MWRWHLIHVWMLPRMVHSESCSGIHGVSGFMLRSKTWFQHHCLIPTHNTKSIRVVRLTWKRQCSWFDVAKACVVRAMMKKAQLLSEVWWVITSTQRDHMCVLDLSQPLGPCWTAAWHTGEGTNSSKIRQLQQYAYLGVTKKTNYWLLACWPKDGWPK